MIGDVLVTLDKTLNPVGEERGLAHSRATTNEQIATRLVSNECIEFRQLLVTPTEQTMACKQVGTDGLAVAPTADASNQV